jgi:hypothetical protein
MKYEKKSGSDLQKIIWNEIIWNETGCSGFFDC